MNNLFKKLNDLSFSQKLSVLSSVPIVFTFASTDTVQKFYIKHRLLKSRAKAIVPEEVRRLCANTAGDGGIGCLLPGVVDDGFANSHDVGCIRENFDDLDNTPIAH